MKISHHLALMKLTRPSLIASVLLILIGNLGLGSDGLDIDEGSLPNHQILSWIGKEGVSYSIQVSLDQEDWFYLPVIEDGRNETIEYGIDSQGDKVFFRLAYSEDGDRLADEWEEAFQLDFLPDAAVEFSDTDADGFLNVFEFFKKTDPSMRSNRPDTDISIRAPTATIQMGIDAATADYFILEVNQGPWTGSENEELVLNPDYRNFHLSAPEGGIETVQVTDG